MNFNHTTIVTQSLIIHKKNQPDSWFKVVLPCSVMYLDRSHIYNNKSKFLYNQFVLQICHHKYNSDRLAALLTAVLLAPLAPVFAFVNLALDLLWFCTDAVSGCRVWLLPTYGSLQDAQARFNFTYRQHSFSCNFLKLWVIWNNFFKITEGGCFIAGTLLKTAASGSKKCPAKSLCTLFTIGISPPQVHGTVLRLSSALLGL